MEEFTFDRKTAELLVKMLREYRRSPGDTNQLGEYGGNSQPANVGLVKIISATATVVNGSSMYPGIVVFRNNIAANNSKETDPKCNAYLNAGGNTTDGNSGGNTQDAWLINAFRTPGIGDVYAALFAGVHTDGKGIWIVSDYCNTNGPGSCITVGPLVVTDVVCSGSSFTKTQKNLVIDWCKRTITLQ
jgi:hypothetical protein